MISLALIILRSGLSVVDVLHRGITGKGGWLVHDFLIVLVYNGL